MLFLVFIKVRLGQWDLIINPLNHQKNLPKLQAKAADKQSERRGAQQAKEKGRRTGKAPGGGRRVSGTVVGVCLVPVGGYGMWV